MASDELIEMINKIIDERLETQFNRIETAFIKLIESKEDNISKKEVLSLLRELKNKDYKI